MKNGWSFRQYDVFRKIFGLYLLVHFLLLIPYGTEIFSNEGVISKAVFSPLIKAFPNVFLWFDSPMVVWGVLSIGALLSVLFMFGKKDKFAAFFLWVILTSLFGRNPLISNPSLPFVGWMLLAHLFIPGKPKDPFGKWCFPKEIFAVAWIVMSIGYSYSGYTKLSSPSWANGSALFEVLSSPLARDNFMVNAILSFPTLLMFITYFTLGLELLFAPIASIKRVRPYLWVSMLLMHIGLVFFLRFMDLTFGMIMIHLFTFNPAWVKPRQTPIKVYYDGECGFCHKFIQFVLQELPKGATNVMFAPQKEESKTILVCDEERGITLRKTEAIEAILKSLGGIYRIGASVIWLLPFSDFFYDRISSVRHKFFETPATSCPVIPSELDDLFKDD